MGTSIDSGNCESFPDKGELGQTAIANTTTLGGEGDSDSEKDTISVVLLAGSCRVVAVMAKSCS